MRVAENGFAHMYSENVYFPDVFKGCKHDCVYCRPSFQRQAKRQRKRCQKCYDFVPHNHFERMIGKSPATKGSQIVFFPKGGDPCFATGEELDSMFGYVLLNPQTTFFMQTKNPQFLWFRQQLPPNLIVSITLETDANSFMYFENWKNPSDYNYYSEISKAPSPQDRFWSFLFVNYPRKAITIEPILQFTLNLFVDRIQRLHPEFVYVGYDNHGCHLPEPSLADTERLIVELRKFTEVRLKTIRKAWWEEIVQ